MAELTNVKGLSELQAILSALPVKLEKNIMRAALRQGANVVMKKARQNVSAVGATDTGLMRKGIKVSTASKGGRIVARVRATGKHGYIANWIEFGVQPHSIKKGAKVKSGKYQSNNPHPGFTAKPFLRPALDTEMQAAVIAVGNTIKKVLSTKHGLDTPMIEVEAA
jgi:HK97 gp10 family phage protein